MSRVDDEHALTVEVAFESSAAGTFDLVIGADGTRSTTRSLAFGSPATDGVHPLGAVMAYFWTAVASPMPRWFLMYWAPGRRMLALERRARRRLRAG